METLKSIGLSLKNNIPGAIIGGFVGYYAAKKYGHVENRAALFAIAILASIGGASIEYKIKARTVKPALDAAKR